MAKIGRTCKEYMVNELSEMLKSNPNLFVTDCTGLNVSELGNLRNNLKNIKVSYLVIKNSLGKLALKNIKKDALIPLVEGTTGLALGVEDPISTSKMLVKFSKASGKLKIKGGVLDGKLLTENEIKEISLLPPKDILLARVFGSMKTPITRFVTALQGTVNKFVYALMAIKEKKERG